jgi:hypothetical protein
VLVKLASVDTTLLALLLAKNLPGALKRIRSDASSVQGHPDTMDSSVDRIDLGRCKAEAHRINLVEMTEDLKLKLVGERLQCGATVELGEE